MDSGANHHFLAGDVASVPSVAHQYTGIKKELEVAIHGHKPLAVEMVELETNNLGLNEAATRADLRLNLISVSRLTDCG